MEYYRIDTLYPALVAFGGNLPSIAGLTPNTIMRAASELDKQNIRVVALSPLYATPCFPAGAGPDYVNAAAAVETSLSPRELLDRLHEIEQAFDRERKDRWGSRTLDLDLLSWADAVLPDLETYEFWRDLPAAEQRRATPDRLILPHPRLAERGFVLVPLADVAPGWTHPVSGLTVREMLARLPAEKLEGIERIRDPNPSSKDFSQLG